MWLYLLNFGGFCNSYEKKQYKNVHEYFMNIMINRA